MSEKAEFTKTEIERRREEALKRMLSTPHQPHKISPQAGSPKSASRSKSAQKSKGS